MSEHHNLWHYTCAHAIGAIRTDRLVRPRPHPVLGHLALSWWTDIAWPTSPESLGLTSHILSCDRMEYRVRAEDTAEIVPWTQWARPLDALTRGLLEVPGTMPAHWYVASTTVPIALDGGAE